MSISAGIMAGAGARTVGNLIKDIRNARYHPAVPDKMDIESFVDFIERLGP
jgi:hypothetical protein